MGEELSMMHPYFSSFWQFIAMGHYAIFVWCAYVVVFLSLLITYYCARKKYKRLQLQLRSRS